MVLPVVVYGSSILRKKTQIIDKDYPDLQQLIENMFDTMHRSDGVGIAAPQVGKSIRLFVVDASPLDDEEDEEEDEEEDDEEDDEEDEKEDLSDFTKVFINAQIVLRDGEMVPFNEGCLSIPSIREDVMRPSHIKIEYYDENFDFHSEEYVGTKARIIQHEYDHLDGILFTDHLSPLKKRLLAAKLNAISKGKVEVDYKIKIAK